MSNLHMRTCVPTCVIPQVLQSKAICVHKGLMLLTLTTVPFSETNFPANISKVIQGQQPDLFTLLRQSCRLWLQVQDKESCKTNSDVSWPHRLDSRPEEGAQCPRWAADGGNARNPSLRHDISQIVLHKMSQFSSQSEPILDFRMI